MKLLLSIKFSIAKPRWSVSGLPQILFFEFRSPTIIVLVVKSEARRFVSKSELGGMYRLVTVM